MAKKSKRYIIGIDIGGTKMSAVLFDGARVLADDTLATPKDSLDHFLVMVKAIAESMLGKAKELKVKVSGLGLSVAGVIDYEEKKILKSPNIPIINGVKLGKKITEMVEMPALMDNDVNCFVRAETLLGAGQKYGNIYGIIMGTGIGGGWWINNEIYRGAFGGAGEPGKMVIDFDNKIGLEEAYHKLTQSNPAAMAEEAYRGDVLAQDTFKEIGNYMGLALANIANIIDPEVFIIGGGAVESGDLFLTQVKKSMRAQIESSVSVKKIKVVKSKLGSLAGAMGAAMLGE